MKLAPLLAQYLYEHKQLHLAGLGSFFLDSSYQAADSQTGRITFENNPAAKEDDELISYISANSGKMKALASSDLSSYLELARQFLNIGKPFQIEGIGTLVKTKTRLEFVAENAPVEKTRENNSKELAATSTSDHSLTTYESLKPQTEGNPAYRKILIAALILGSTALIVWAGYYFYKSNSGNNEETVQTVEPKTEPAVDTTQLLQHKSDTLTGAKPVENAVPADKYRFVIEVANKKRAFYRLDMLRKGGLPVQIYTTDSITYKLYFLIAATPADTAKIADSLSVIYPALNHRKAFAEK